MNIIENEENWDHRLIDDAALGKLFDLNKIKQYLVRKCKLLKSKLPIP